MAHRSCVGKFFTISVFSDINSSR